MRIFGTSNQKSKWEREEMIPLGLTKGESPTIIYKRMTYLADTMFFFARPGVGKSVVMKACYFYLWLSGRPLVIFDPTGMDHSLSYLPNKYARNLPPGIRPTGLNVHPNDPEKKVLYLNVSKEYLKPWERHWIPCIYDMGVAELKSFGFSDGAIDEIKKVLKIYSPFEDYESLIDFVNKFPTNPQGAESYKKKNERGMGRSITQHHAFYQAGVFMNQQTKSNLLRILYKIQEQGSMELNKSGDFNFLDWIKKGNSVVFSFNRNYELTRAVVSMISKQIIAWKTRGGGGIQPWFIFEEMDKVFPNEPKENEKGVVEFCSELILQLRKTSVGIMGSCASIIRTNRNILENAHNTLFGQIRGRNLGAIDYNYGKFVMEKVKSLFWNRFINKREFLYVDEFYNNFIIEPYDSPCEIHREQTKKKEVKKKS